MTTFKLGKFPYVCRLCLESVTEKKMMITVDTVDPVLDGTALDFITAITFKISEDKARLLPQKICAHCLELLRFFAKYRIKIMATHLLMDSLVDLKRSNSKPIQELFASKKDLMTDLCKDLALCNKREVLVQDLLDEFQTYGFASMSENPEDENQSEPSEPEAKKSKRYTRTFCCTVPNCTLTFDDVFSYQRHVLDGHKVFVCETCGIRCFTRSSLKEHQERHLPISNQHVCPYCRKNFKMSGDLRTHIRNWHLASTTYSCSTCGVEFKRKDVRDLHQKSHENVYDYPCTACDKKFKVPARLRRHHEEVHERRRHICEYCSKPFPKLTKLKDHIESVHGVQMRFVCDICVSTFLSQEELDTHKPRHDQPGQLGCSVCLAIFSSDDELKEHLCITYRDDYVCCERDFRQAYAYNKHMFLKHGTKTNVRVKPVPGQLMGTMRAQRKRIESCPKCEIILPTRAKKKQHMESCVGSAPTNALSDLPERSGAMDTSLPVQTSE
ncbi:zinc finger protein 81-like [Ochlerotatus camptorhynchus]|uniref:zinc finger protein 81-like n=1 Tax=Ochlerotatus camptorhynchus TaxID=644619 RepID=UPI0031E4818F